MGMHPILASSLLLLTATERCAFPHDRDGKGGEGQGGRGGAADCEPAGGNGGAGGVCQDVPDLVQNGGFEDAAPSLPDAPEGWSFTAFDPSGVGEWATDEAFSGLRSAKIVAPNPNDAAWIQSVPVQPDTLYFLSGYIKTNGVAHSAESVDAGANLSIFDSFTFTTPLYGTEDWTRRGVLFNSGPTANVTIAARLGYFSGTTSGRAWFDEVHVQPIVPVEPHPSWRILALVYDRTELDQVDQNGVAHHYVAQMSSQELATVTDELTRFVESDIPALNEGNMIPSLTIRYPSEPLDTLTPVGDAWWPSQVDTAPDLDPAFDSVIVIWDPRAIDEATNQPVTLNNFAGLTPGNGTGQTYAAIIMDALTSYGHRNVLKHEWGHSILFFFDAAGVAPKPAVDNHATPDQYVHCGTGDSYVWVDESEASPIPNSIYNNDSGFTHDYYSGQTALASDPATCLGVTPAAWAMGGPVSHSGNLECVAAPPDR